MVAEVEVLWLGEEFHAVDIVETAGTLARHLHVLLLILAHRHFGSTVLKDVGSHEGGVGQQTCVDVVGLFASLLLEGGHTFQLAQVAVHVEIEVQLDGLGHVALYVDG